MVGKFDIEVYNNKAHYFLTIKRNITILQGDSASGKSELIRLIGEHEANGNSSGITVKCDKKCTVLTNVDWELRLSSLKQSIIFIDETAAFLKNKKFAKMVRGADNYFVIVSRDDLVQLPYSVEEIYGLKNVSDSSKYKAYKKVYNEMYKLYNLMDINDKVEADQVITEDILDIPKTVLEETYNYADSKKYMSWEEYYTDYLVQNSRGTVFKYAKAKLNENYKAPKIIEKIKGAMPEQIL